MKVLVLLKIACLSFSILLIASNSRAQSVIKIASKDTHSMTLKSDGSLWVKNLDGITQLMPGGVTAVSCGGNDTGYFLKSDGSMWAIPHYGRTDPPVRIVSSGVIAVAAGDTSVFFLKNDGSLWGFGFNMHGQLGDDLDEDYDSDNPQKLVESGVVAIAAGDYHILFIKNDGSLWGMGGNGDGQLGDGTDENRTKPKRIVAANVTAVAAGNLHSLFVKSDGSLWAMGANESGQLGDGTDEESNRPKQVDASNVVAVTAGHFGSMFLKKDGTLWAMGLNWFTDYGDGIEFDSERPVQILGATTNNAPLVAGYYYSATLKGTANILSTRFNNYNTTSKGESENSVKSMLTGASQPGYNSISIQLLNDGNVQVSYLGTAGKDYALDRSFSLTTPVWTPQMTNTADKSGSLVITNTPVDSTNNFWRIRSVP